MPFSGNARQACPWISRKISPALLYFVLQMIVVLGSGIAGHFIRDSRLRRSAWSRLNFLSVDRLVSRYSLLGPMWASNMVGSAEGLQEVINQL